MSRSLVYLIVALVLLTLAVIAYRGGEPLTAACLSFAGGFSGFVGFIEGRRERP